MTKSDTHQLLLYVLEILKMLTEAGAEIYRVEESAVRIFKAYGAKNVDVYATTSNIIVSVEDENGIIKTHTKRIGKTSTDLEKIHLINNLTRKIASQRPTVKEIGEDIKKLQSSPEYSNTVLVLFYGVIAGAFYCFFGGRNTIEFIAAVLIGFMTGYINNILGNRQANQFLVKFACSFFACFIAFSLLKLNIIDSIDNIIISNIMALIPGIGLTNSLRDLFVGDSVSGVLKLIESALLALSIACGYIAVSFIFGGAII